MSDREAVHTALRRLVEAVGSDLAACLLDNAEAEAVGQVLRHPDAAPEAAVATAVAAVERVRGEAKARLDRDRKVVAALAGW